MSSKFLLEQAIFLPIVIFFPYHVSSVVFIAYVAYKLIDGYFLSTPGASNPFEKDDRQPRKPYELDQKKRDAVLKQAFAKDKVPDDLDAIVIGSGIGGLACAAIMAKAGKKVLVLEQHDQAGGCCHTYIDKGYEFDVGIHYIGEMDPKYINRTFVDQITDGQLQWEPLENDFDIVSIGYGKDQKKYPVRAGKNAFKTTLLERFPNESKAINEYFDLINGCGRSSTISGLLKMLPLWLSWIIINTGIVNWLTTSWTEKYKPSTKEIIENLTDNEDLRCIFCYCWGDYGTPPDQSHFSMQSGLVRHFIEGAYYPVGGASEIAYNIIPVIERAGGKVLVRVSVTDILMTDGKASGVRVKKGTQEHILAAKTIISSAGLYNTFQRLLPKEVAAKSYYTEMAGRLKPAIAGVSVFVGLDASNEELNLKKNNTWSFIEAKAAMDVTEYTTRSGEAAINEDVPLLFVSFPSTKDPNWALHEGRSSKATCALVTLAPWEWFSKWVSKPLKHRGDDYDEFKKALGHRMIEQACQLFPQIRPHIDYVDIGTPVTNAHYLAAPHGEIYGLDHTAERFHPWNAAKLRPKTDIPGLFLTGQDIMSGGFTGALFGALLAANQILERNVMNDMQDLHKRLQSEGKKDK